MKKLTILTMAMLFTGTILSAQEWQQTASAPEGGGVTEILVHPENNNIFVTTSSYDYPYGENGGVRRSVDDGDTWENLYDAYVGRTIMLADDGNLYASIWPYPAHEGLYRSTDNGDNWDLVTMISFGNNFFSIVVNTHTNPHSIFAGTRLGVIRSLDDGLTWDWANEGIPWAVWIRCMDIDSAGVIVAGTTVGVFSSENNGDTWEQATGAGIENDTITKIIFDYPFDSKDYLSRLLAGSSTGNVYESFGESKYLMATMLEIFNGEASGVFIYKLKEENKKIHGISTFPKGTQPSGFNYSTNDGATWQQNNTGMPNTESPNISALSGSSNPYTINLKAGLFENMNGGALVFRMTYDWSTITGIADQDNMLPDENEFSVFPNPSSGSMNLRYTIFEQGLTTFELFGISGEKLKTLVDEPNKPGVYEKEIDLSDLPKGVYFCVLKTNPAHAGQTKKMIKL